MLSKEFNEYNQITLKDNDRPLHYSHYLNFHEGSYMHPSIYDFIVSSPVA